MQLSNIYDVSKTKLHGKMNSINTPIFSFLCESSMGTCKSRAHRSRGHHYKTGERKKNQKTKVGRVAGRGGEGEKLTK